MAIGVFCLVFALEMASLANQYWQLLLSQGILFGIGSSLVFIPSIGLPSQWFLAKRGIATGISSAGTGVGAVILSPVGQGEQLDSIDLIMKERAKSRSSPTSSLFETDLDFLLYLATQSS